MNFICQLFSRFFALFNIKIYSGEDRIVFLFPFLGIVIKFPKSEKGSRTNFQEWRFWKRKRNIFCQPTYFAFKFKTLNSKKTFWICVQKLSHQLCDMDPEEFFIKLSILTRRMSESDGHHFNKPNNFCYDRNGRLKMLDYGSRQTQKVISKCGERVYCDFDRNRKQTFEDLVALIEALEGIRDVSQSHKII